MRRILVPVTNIATVETRRKHQWLDDSSEDGGFEAPRKMPVGWRHRAANPFDNWHLLQHTGAGAVGCRYHGTTMGGAANRELGSSTPPGP